jgi:hypothetical protein
MDLPGDSLGEASMEELAGLLIEELRSELRAIQSVVGDLRVPVGGLLGEVLRETSSRLADGVEIALGGGAAPANEPAAEAPPPFAGKRALLLEADGSRRATLGELLAGLGLEVLPPVPDLTTALESGLAWAPDVFVGGAPEQDSLTCIRILRRDVALSSMLWVLARWGGTDRQWPNAVLDVETLRPRLRRQLAEAFSPLRSLEEKLLAGGPVAGRLESYGMPALLQLALATRRWARITVTEGNDHLEGLVADGQVRDARWVEVDGNVANHFEAFVRLLGAKRGRFVVADLAEPPAAALPGSYGELLAAACAWWRPLAMTVDQRLAEIGPVAFDQRRAAEFARQASRPIRTVLKHLGKGDTPSQIMAAGIDEATVAGTLRELVRRLAVGALPLTSATTPPGP